MADNKQLIGGLITVVLFTALFPTIYESLGGGNYTGTVAVVVPLISVVIVVGLLYSIGKDWGIV